MFRPILLLLVFVVALSALSDKEIIKRAQGFMQSSNKSNYFRAYNDYKNLYLRSIMLEDESLQITSLKGIVKSGKKLHIDVGQYSDELQSMQPKSVYKKGSKAPSHVKKKDK